MVVLGVTVSRLRAAYTSIARPRLVSIDMERNPITIPPAVIHTKLVSFQNVPADSQPDTFIEAIRLGLKLFDTESKLLSDEALNVSAVGLLDTPPLPAHAGSGRGTSLDLIKLHAIVSHEIRKEFRLPVSSFSIGSARFALGISDATASDAKRGMIAQFKEAVLNRDDTSTVSGYQAMAESWSVSVALERARLLSELKHLFPGMVERARVDVSRRKVFQKSDVVKVKDSVISQLVDAEVDKLLIKRFNL